VVFSENRHSLFGITSAAKRGASTFKMMAVSRHKSSGPGNSLDAPCGSRNSDANALSPDTAAFRGVGEFHEKDRAGNCVHPCRYRRRIAQLYGSSGLSGTGSNPSSHYVSPHTTSTGTYVSGHYQTNPNGTQLDNYGTRGNVNPYTGAVGTRGARY
jgi:hypothetical protein